MSSPIPNALAEFPARTLQHPRRAFIRFSCAPANIGKLYSTVDEVFQTIWLLNLSQGGAGVQTSRPLATGLEVSLHVRSEGERRLFLLHGEVVHATEQIPGEWTVGVRFFDPLAPDDLEQLLA